MNKIIREIKNIFTLRAFKERRLSFELALSTSIIVIMIVLCIGWYINAAMAALNDRAKSQNTELNIAMAATVMDFLDKDISNGNFNEVAQKLQHMISNRLIAYLIVQDNTKKKVVFSTLEKSSSVNIVGIKLIPASSADYSLRQTSYIPIKRHNYTLFVGFYSTPLYKVYFDILLKQLTSLIFVFMFMGLMLSFALSKKITSPLTALIKATGEFEQGDLSNRVEKTSYKEINELVSSYNSMADALQRLYSSLGQKVQERTQQLEEAYEELQNTQAMMVHSEKMKSLGELVAGIMHEINNPINFIYGNMTHLSNYSNDLIKIIDTLKEYTDDLSPEHKQALEELMQEVDYEFLKDDLPDLIRSCKEGTERTKNIILDLKDFSRLEEIALTSVDLPKEFDTTLNILHNKFKHKITVHKEFEENLPKVEAYGGQLNQVFMNILDNAAFAIDEQEHGDVWIRIKTDNGNAIIEIEDNGKGMDEKTANKIFDPFFTTKPVGQGTGLGMSISYKVVKNHQGNIRVDSEVGKGTKFTITLPINRAQEQQLIKGDSAELEVIE